MGIKDSTNYTPNIAIYSETNIFRALYDLYQRHFNGVTRTMVVWFKQTNSEALAAVNKLADKGIDIFINISDDADLSRCYHKI